MELARSFFGAANPRDFAAFAKSWDRFARAKGKSRAATAREVRILICQLEDSLQSADGLELDRAIKDHRRLLSRSRRTRRALRELADPRGEILARRLPSRAPRELEAVAGPDEHHLGHDAGGGDLQ